MTTGITTWTATGKVWRSGYGRKFVFCSGYNAPTRTKDGIDVQLDTLSMLLSIVSGQAALLKPDNPSSSSTRDVLGSSVGRALGTVTNALYNLPIPRFYY